MVRDAVQVGRRACSTAFHQRATAGPGHEPASWVEQSKKFQEQPTLPFCIVPFKFTKYRLLNKNSETRSTVSWGLPLPEESSLRSRVVLGLVPSLPPSRRRHRASRSPRRKRPPQARAWVVLTAAEHAAPLLRTLAGSLQPSLKSPWSRDLGLWTTKLRAP